jgi:hypothetical protein
MCWVSISLFPVFISEKLLLNLYNQLTAKITDTLHATETNNRRRFVAGEAKLGLTCLHLAADGA